MRSVAIRAVPATALPVDSTGNASVQAPMDGNDQYGDCGMAMADHTDRILCWRQGKGVQLNTSVQALESQYLRVSGGDNGMDETMLVGPQGVWTPAGGGIADDPARVIVDSLDVPWHEDAINYCIDQFYAVEMAWSVPDEFIQNFQAGGSYLSPMQGDPKNGHYTPLADIDAKGNYRLWTWGAWCWVSPSFLDAVDPVFFVVFSEQQFDPATGLDSKGRHITTQAAAWQGMGGNPIPQSILAKYPPINGPTPAPTPVPTPVPIAPPVPARQIVDALFAQMIAALAGHPIEQRVLEWAQQIIDTNLGDQAKRAWPGPGPFRPPFRPPLPLPVESAGYHTLQIPAGVSYLDGNLLP